MGFCSYQATILCMRLLQVSLLAANPDHSTGGRAMDWSRSLSSESLLWLVLIVPLLVVPAAVTVSPGRAVTAKP